MEEKMLSVNIRYSWLLLGTLQRPRHIKLKCLYVAFIEIQVFKAETLTLLRWTRATIRHNRLGQQHSP